MSEQRAAAPEAAAAEAAQLPFVLRLAALVAAEATPRGLRGGATGGGCTGRGGRAGAGAAGRRH